MENNDVTITNLAEQLEVSKSTVHRHLKTLQKFDFVTVHEGTYNIGLEFLNFGTYARDQWEIYDAAKDQLHELVSDIGEKGWIIVEENGTAVYIYGAFGEHHVKTQRAVGARDELYRLAGGKAILANMDEDRSSEIIQITELSEVTEHTITDEHKLHNELEEIRDSGYAFNQHELMEGMYAIAVPIKKQSSGVYGALSISGPSSRLTIEKMENDVIDRLKGVAHEIELNLWYG